MISLVIEGEWAKLQDFGTCSFHSFYGEDGSSRKLFPIRALSRSPLLCCCCGMASPGAACAELVPPCLQKQRMRPSWALHFLGSTESPSALPNPLQACSAPPAPARQLSPSSEAEESSHLASEKSSCSPCNGMGWAVGQGGSQPAACLLVTPFFLTSYFFFSDDLQLDHSWN